MEKIRALVQNPSKKSFTLSKTLKKVPEGANMARTYIKITTQPEIIKGKKGTSFRYRIPAHHGQPARWSKARQAQGKKKGEILAEAEAYRQELEEEINDWRSNADITLGKYAREWHDERKDSDEITQRTWEREEITIKDIEESEIANIAINEIEPEDIEKAKKANTRKGWSKNKQARFVSKVKQITKEAAGKRRIKFDPGATIKAVKEDPKKRRAIPAAVIGEMLDILENEEKNGKAAAIRIALGTGYRRGEVLGLQWGDIELKPNGGVIHLRRQLTAKKELTDPKYDSKGDTPIGADLAQWLTEWRQEARAMYKGQILPANAPICCNEKGDYLNPTNFSRWFRQWMVKHRWGTYESEERTRDAAGDARYHRTGYQGYTFHEIRHSMATQLLGSGADLKSTQAIMRHTRITTTEGYIHEIPQNVKNAMQGVEKAQRTARGAAEYAAFMDADPEAIGTI